MKKHQHLIVQLEKKEEICKNMQKKQDKNTQKQQKNEEKSKNQGNKMGKH